MLKSIFKLNLASSDLFVFSFEFSNASNSLQIQYALLASWLSFRRLLSPSPVGNPRFSRGSAPKPKKTTYFRENQLFFAEIVTTSSYSLTERHARARARLSVSTGKADTKIVAASQLLAGCVRPHPNISSSRHLLLSSDQLCHIKWDSMGLHARCSASSSMSVLCTSFSF